MSYDEADAWHDVAMDALYEQFFEDASVREQFYQDLYDEIVRDFADSRLRSFYEDHPDIAATGLNALADAKALLAHHHAAALVFGAIAAEVGLRSTLLEPIVHGLVHAETAASLIAKLAIEHRDERFTKILLDLVAAHGGVDPRTYRRTGSAKPVWEEMVAVRAKRNRVLHQADVASHEDAVLAINVAECILNELFPGVVKKLGLHLHGSSICNIPPTVVGGHRTP